MRRLNSNLIDPVNRNRYSVREDLFRMFSPLVNHVKGPTTWAELQLNHFSDKFLPEQILDSCGMVCPRIGGR